MFNPNSRNGNKEELYFIYDENISSPHDAVHSEPSEITQLPAL